MQVQGCLPGDMGNSKPEKELSKGALIRDPLQERGIERGNLSGQVNQSGHER